MDINETLKETARIWNVLADNPSMLKYRVPGASKYRHYCPCCTYVEKMYNIDKDSGMSSVLCRNDCPMWEAWGNEFCEWYGPYTKWVQQSGVISSYDKSFFALLIAEWAEYLLTKNEE